MSTPAIIRTTPSMTTSATPTAKADRVETFLDWFRINSRIVAIGGAAVVVAGAIYWFVTNQAQRNDAEAFRQLSIARQSMGQGNTALATRDLQSLVQQRGGTPSGIQGAMLLAELHYQKGEYQKGIDVLNAAAREADEADTRAAILALTADGQVQLGKFQEAADAYQRAADAAQFDGQRALYLAARARALTSAGKAADAQKAWSDLATNPAYASVAGEARVRLGELSAKPATR